MDLKYKTKIYGMTKAGEEESFQKKTLLQMIIEQQTMQVLLT